MGIGTSLFLVALGAILYFAVSASISGISLATVGLILMIVGAIGGSLAGTVVGAIAGAIAGLGAWWSVRRLSRRLVV